MRPLIYAHRGAMAECPQNTMAAFTRAWETGCDGIELDVQCSEDGIPFVFHDDTLDSLTGASGRIRDYGADAIEAFDAGSHFSPRFSGERIPRLGQVLETCPEGCLLNIELKSDIPDDAQWKAVIRTVTGWNTLRSDPDSPRETECRRLAAAVARCVREAGKTRPYLENMILFSSFDPAALSAIARELPGARLGFLWSTAIRYDTRPLMKHITHQCWHPHFRLTGKRDIDEKHAEGKKVNVWTVNDEKTARRLAAFGVDGIITNHPARMMRLFC